jgi:SAM-dependent methyltransferase
MTARQPAGHSDEREMLRQWGDDAPGPMNGESGRRLADAVLSAIAGIDNVTRICDLGCGNGFLAAQLAARGYSVTGVDASERLLALARRHYASDRIQYREAMFGPALLAELGNEPHFDLVLSVDVVEHLYRPSTLFETADGLVKPGGHLVVCTPYHGYLKNLAISLLGQWDSHHGVHWEGGHIKFFSVPTLRQAVGQRFTVERFEYYGRFPGFWKNMICIARKPIR